VQVRLSTVGRDRSFRTQFVEEDFRMANEQPKKESKLSAKIKKYDHYDKLQG
jgi:hypothetical protein